MIPLSEILRQISYDPATGVFRWRVSKSGVRGIGCRAGANSNGYQTIQVNGRRFYGNVLAWYIMTGEMPPRQVDHKNRKRHDDRWSNLRLATRTQQMQNTSLYSNNRARVRGVRKHKNGKWEARLSVNKKPLYLGLFATKYDAKAAYQNAAVKHFGQFAAHLN